MADSQLRQALQKSFQDIDKDKSGFIDCKEVEEALRRYRDCPECQEKMDDAHIKQEAAHFMSQADTNKDRKVSLQEYLDYYQSRLKK